MHLHRVLVLALIAGTATTAIAEDKLRTQSRTEGPRSRAVGASSRLLGCNPSTNLPCEGSWSTRTGLNVAEGEYRKDGGTSPMAKVQLSANPQRDLLASQVIATTGVKQRLGKGYVSAGIGLAAKQTARGPKPIRSIQVAHAARPALSVGIGADVETKLDQPVTFALDVGSTVDDDTAGAIYQALASVTHRF